MCPQHSSPYNSLTHSRHIIIKANIHPEKTIILLFVNLDLQMSHQNPLSLDLKLYCEQIEGWPPLHSLQKNSKSQCFFNPPFDPLCKEAREREEEGLEFY